MTSSKKQIPFGNDRKKNSYSRINGYRQRLAVDLTEDDVDAADDGDYIGEELAFAHGFEGLQGGEAGVAHVDAIGLGGAV